MPVTTVSHDGSTNEHATIDAEAEALIDLAERKAELTRQQAAVTVLEEDLTAEVEAAVAGQTAYVNSLKESLDDLTPGDSPAEHRARHSLYSTYENEQKSLWMMQESI